MNHSHNFEASIETHRGLEPLNLDDGNTGLFLMSALRRDLAYRRPFPPKDVYYQFIPHCLPNGMLFLDGIEFNVEDDSPGISVTVIIDDHNPLFPSMHPLDAYQRSYQTEEFDYFDLQALRFVAIQRLAQTN